MTMFVLDGQSLDLRADAFTSLRARETFAALQWYPYYRLLEAKVIRESKVLYDTLVIEVSVELPQDRTYDIRYREHLALCFDHNDKILPRVKVLRGDFPVVPHETLVPLGSPREFCLYTEPLEIIRLTWTAPDFLGRVSNWLAKTAIGTLHALDQPLEPFLLASCNEVIVPHSVHDASHQQDKRLIAFPIVRDQQAKQLTLRLGWQSKDDAEKWPWIVFPVILTMPPRVHGFIHQQPRNLQDLCTTLAKEECDFLPWLRKQLQNLYLEKFVPRDCDLLMLLLEIPHQRDINGSIERLERWAFILGKSIAEVAFAVRAYEKSREGHYGLIITSQDEPKCGSSDLPVISIDPLRVVSDLTRSDASHLSGLPTVCERRCVLIGAGALGAQIYFALARMGWGNWTLVDPDIFLPHNSVRHILGDCAVGSFKVKALQQIAALDLPYNQPHEVIPENALDFTHNQTLARTFAEADIIVDVSTSLAVARAFARDVERKARCVSVFLTPSGKESVLIMEDADRTTPLDVLEQQYYRAIIRSDALREHLQGHQGAIRYGGSCRDVTTVIAQDNILLHAGILARQIRRGMEDTNPQVTIWRSNDDGSTNRFPIELTPCLVQEVKGWHIRYNDALLARCMELREQKLPRETGGVLVGYYDALHKTLYVVDALPPPVDSLEHTTAFVRGTKNLQEELEAIKEKTAHIVQYVGEWHSHPTRASVHMSGLDQNLLQEIANSMRYEGWPGVILIVGDKHRHSFYMQTCEDT